jgi:hypothetical protein
MKVALAVAAGLVLFTIAAVGLWRTVGGLVDQAGSREEHAVSLRVTVSYQDGDARPVGEAQLRMIFGGDPTRLSPDAPETAVTDARGLATFVAPGRLDKVQRKRPTNFISSLLEHPELTDHLSVGTELEYAGHRWLYVVHLYRFSDGDVVHDGLTLFTPDERGRYTRKAERDGGGWKIADLPSARMTTIGHDVTVLRFAPENDPAEWTLSLGFIRQPEPLHR